MCISLDRCLLPLHECRISRVRFRFPFNDFEVEVLNLLKIASSQMQMVRGEYVKVFRYWCEYNNGILTLKMFFHLFNVQNTFTKVERERWLLSLYQSKIFFDIFIDNFKNFKVMYFLTITQSREAHLTLCVFPECFSSCPNLELVKCVDRFSNYWNHNYFTKTSKKYML